MRNESNSKKSENPHFCIENDNELLAGKIWELLRRNRKFLRDVEKLIYLDKQIKKAKDPKKKQSKFEESVKFLQNKTEHNNFARIAMQWLAPDPLIHYMLYEEDQRIWKTAVIKPEELSKPKKTWEWKIYNSSTATCDSKTNSLCRGPEIVYVESTGVEYKSDDPKYIEEWKSGKPQTGGKLFTYETFWNDAPAGFRLAFSNEWSQIDSRTVNPNTGIRSESPEHCEISQSSLRAFRAMVSSKDLIPIPVVNILIPNTRILADKRVRTPSKQYEVSSKEITDLPKDLRVFAVPNCIITKSKAQEVGKWIAGNLVPKDKATPMQCDDRLAEIEELIEPSDDSIVRDKTMLELWDLFHNYQIYAISDTLGTAIKSSTVKNWFVNEITKGNDYLGNITAKGLPKEQEIGSWLGSSKDWEIYLRHLNGEALFVVGNSNSSIKDLVTQHTRTDVNNIIKYMDNVVEAVYPDFDIPRLLKASKHRQHRNTKTVRRRRGRSIHLE